ncbi:MAG: tRNA threonylcarbamoyladenosine dehydratase [Clostridiales bacterium]|nr:tRNA threonylcarbamoyladenosine dehydratase [Clostridiales bacterium]
MLDLSRTQRVLGNLDKLKHAHVAVFGLGGVGGIAAEALVRGGIGELTIVDGDVVSSSNINRQIIAQNDNMGQRKVDVMAKRLLSINPDLVLHAKDIFFLPENRNEFDFDKFDFVADAVDTVTAKLELAEIMGERIISCMGTGNRIDPTAFRVGDVFQTSYCPLAKVMRRELRRRGITSLKVVYSIEEPVKTGVRTPGSVSFVPGGAGYTMAGEIIKFLLSN